MLTSSADEEGCDIFSKECLIIDRKTIKKEKRKQNLVKRLNTRQSFVVPQRMHCQKHIGRA